jgi:ubiquinone/menaquinone biosynthesis C-methylase UbiE
MVERHRNEDVELSNFHQYEGSSLNVLTRALIYDKYAKPHIILREEMTRSLHLNGDETILDTGCGDARWLRSLIEDHGHTGPLVGINDSENLLTLGQQYLATHTNLALAVMDARELEFDDSTFDVVSAQNLYYHIEDYESALLELRRVAKPEAKIVVSTKGDFNQIRIWQGLKLIEQRLQPSYPDWPAHKAPKTFYTHFDLEEAGDILSEYFELVPELSMKQRSNLIIPAEGWDDYERAILSLKDSFQPVPRIADIKKAIGETIKPIFDREVEVKGFFTDYVQQGFFICKNKK